VVLTVTQNINIELFSPECAFSVDFWTKYKISVFLPVFLALLAFALRFIDSVRISRRWRVDWSHMANVLQWLFVALYTSCVSTTLSVFNCKDQLNGIKTLHKEPSVICYQSAWMRQFPAIFFGILLHLLVFPISLVWLFLKNRKNRRSAEFRKNYGLLVKPYSDACYFWECMVILKRVLFVMFSEFLKNEKFLASVAVLMFFFWLDAVAMPYATVEANNLNLT
jgi:hypothetical protein